jgi:hypothetical protein
VALLYGRARRLTTENGGFRPGQGSGKKGQLSLKDLRTKQRAEEAASPFHLEDGGGGELRQVCCPRPPSRPRTRLTSDLCKMNKATYLYRTKDAVAWLCTVAPILGCPSPTKTTMEKSITSRENRPESL